MATQRSRTATKKASLAIAMDQAGSVQHPAAPDPIGAAVEALTEPDHPAVRDGSGASVAAVAAAQVEPHAPVSEEPAHDAGPAPRAEAVSAPTMESTPVPGAGYLVLARAAAAFQGRAIDMLQANAVQAIAFAEAVSGLRSVSAAMELQAEQVLRQFEIMSDQTRQWNALVEKVAGESLASSGQGKRG